MKLSGGSAFEAKMAELAQKVKGSAKLRVGFLEGSTYPEGTPVALVAAFNEFGTAKSPPRAFFRAMIHAKSGEWPGAIAGLLKANDFDAVKTLDQAGAAIGGQLQQSIIDFDSVPLAPSTIARKGHDKQLVDSSVMLKSVAHEVEEGE